MRAALGLAALLGCVACSGEARKLGEVSVSVGGSSGGFDALAGNGGGIATFGGAPGVADSGGSPGSGGSPASVTIGTGGTPGDNGGKLEITREDRDALIANACASVSLNSEQPAAGLELVVDVSASMNEPAPSANGLSKWELTRDALLEAVVGVTGTGLPAWVEVGLLLYPSSGPGQGGNASQVGCSTESELVPRAPLGPLGSPQRALLEERLRSVVPAGATPTLQAYDTGLSQGLLTNAVVGQNYMLLVTDGVPTVENCLSSDIALSPIDPQPIVQRIQEVNQQQGIKTFVVGSFGSEDSRGWLSEAATQGGTPRTGCSNEAGTCHFDLTTKFDLNAALNSGLVEISCTLPYPVPPPGFIADPNQLHVILSSSDNRVPQWWLVLEDTQGDCTEGWQRVDGGIKLCPDTCLKAREIGGEVLMGCAVVTK